MLSSYSWLRGNFQRMIKSKLAVGVAMLTDKNDAPSLCRGACLHWLAQTVLLPTETE